MDRDEAPENGGDDIKSREPGATWIVTGWFTPDYRYWAERLAKSLDGVGASYHLLAKRGSPAGWMASTRRKPDIVLEAMHKYPGKTLILMDVDAVALADLAPLVETGADISAYLRARTTRRGVTNLVASSRVVVLRPTAGARRIVEAWRDKCSASDLADEALFGAALAQSSGVLFTPLAERYAGRERSSAPRDAVIVHDSARDRSIGVRHPGRYLRRLWRKGRQLAGTALNRR